MDQSMAGDSTDEPGSDEDGQLLVAARLHPDVFGEFYDRNHRRVLAYFYRRTFCPHTSADLTAETFAQAWASIKRFNPDSGTGRGWLFGIGGNLYKQWLRRGVVREKARRQLGITTPELSEDDLERIDELIDTSDLRAGLQAALGHLTEATRDAVLMRVALDLPYVEVAELCGCSVGAARVRVARGLNSLAELMEREP
jgi:RNA polymerase sigma-70 factor (ECF subfamily)